MACNFMKLASSTYKNFATIYLQIMDKLLDKEVHQLYKSSGHDSDVSNYLGTKPLDSSTADSSSASTACEGQQQLVASAGDEGVSGVEGRDESRSAEKSSSFTSTQISGGGSTRHSSKTRTSQTRLEQHQIISFQLLCNLIL